MEADSTSSRKFNFHVDGVSRFMQEVAKGLCMPNAHVPVSEKDKSLGDRSTYIGASAATGCLYKAYMDAKNKPEVDSKQIFVFERGHQLEEMVRKGLSGMGWSEIDSVDDYRQGQKSYVHQEEVCGQNGYEYVKGHIDFVFVNSKELVIKEMKSSATLPLSPYMSHVYQVTLQMWLLMSKYPDRNVRASIVYHNWDSGESVDYPIEFNEAFLEVALSQAQTLWIAIQTSTEPIPTRQLYCSKCSYKASCPVLLFGSEADLPQELNGFVGQLSDFKETKKKMSKLQENMKSLMVSAGLKKAKFDDTYVEIVNGQWGPYLKIT